MGFVVVWLVCGFVCAAIASGKGRDGCGWFLIGVLFGPFGILFAFVAEKNVKVVEKEAVDSGAMKKCPFCAELIKREAIKCRYCGETQPQG